MCRDFIDLEPEEALMWRQKGALVASPTLTLLGLDSRKRGPGDDAEYTIVMSETARPTEVVRAVFVEEKLYQKQLSDKWTSFRESSDAPLGSCGSSQILTSARRYG